MATGNRIDYDAYIQSPEWRTKANAAKQRAGYRCQVCNRPSTQIQLDAHHRTYERLGDESPEDITVLCRDCHELFSKQGKKQSSDNSERNAMLFWVAVACVGALIWWYFNSRPAVTTVAANRSAAPAAPQEQDPRADEEKAYRLQQTLEAEQAARDEDMEKSYPYSDTCPTSNRDSNLRAGPSVDYAVIGTVQAGACIPVAAQNADGTWYWFQKEDVFGPNVDVWIRSYLVDNVPPNLPIVDTRSRSTPVSPRQQAQGCPGGCTTYPSWCAGIPIKANISQTTGERIYHVAGQRYYNDTNIDPTYGERWFCTETEAREAGWRKSVR